jgi:hypothetical protein
MRGGGLAGVDKSTLLLGDVMSEPPSEPEPVEPLAMLRLNGGFFFAAYELSLLIIPSDEDFILFFAVFVGNAALNISRKHAAQQGVALFTRTTGRAS